MEGSLRQRVSRCGSAPLVSLLAASLSLLPPAPAAADPRAAESPTEPSLALDPLQLEATERQQFLRAADPKPVASAAAAGETAEPGLAAPSPWAGTLELYGLVPLWVTNTTTIQGFTAESTLTLRQFLDVLRGTFSIRGSVEHGRLGLLTDISYVSLGKQAAVTLPRDRIRLGDGRILTGLEALRRHERTKLPAGQRLRSRALQRLREARENPGEVVRKRAALAQRLARRVRGGKPVTASFRTELSAEQGIYDIALRYRLGARESAVADPGTLTVIPYAGIRILDLNLTIDSQLSADGFSGRSSSRAFGSPQVQPLLGTQAQVFLAPRLRLFARGDVAGFGISAADAFTANAQLGLGYAIGNSTQLALSWRYAHLAGNNGEFPENAYVIGLNGAELGLKFFV
jgi:hypothetical protein